LVISKKYARSEIFISRGNKEENKKIFDYFYKHKDQIEKEFGDKLTWERMENNITSRIKFQKDGFNYYNKESWPEINNFMIDSAERMHRVFKKQVRELRRKLAI